MAAYSLLSTIFHPSPNCSSSFSRSPNRKRALSSISKSLFHHRHASNPSSSSSSSSSSPFIFSLPHHSSNKHNQNETFDFLHTLPFLKKPLDSLLLLCTSLALSLSFFFVDVDSALAFVVTTPRKLQTDELATVRLFQENTPSVVYITNLAARYHYTL